MMKEDKDKVSAWLDDAIELNEVDSLQVENTVGKYSTAARYTMIGDAIRGRVVETSMIDISASVREAISREPALTPVVAPIHHSKPNSRPFFGLGSWLKPAGGLAVAATVAMVMVVTLTEQQSESSEPVVAGIGQQPLQATPVSNTATGYSQAGLALPAVNLNSYVTEHSEYAARDTMQGMMPYARAVSYGSEEDSVTQRSDDDTPVVRNPGTR
jgi:sigma-E factor negative regulatory protein RseA